MKGKSWLVMFVMVCMVAGFSSQASAWWRRERNEEKFRGGPAQMRKMIAKRLKLTDEQKKKFEAMEQETKKEMKASQKELKETGEKLKAELKKESPDRNVIRRHIRELSGIQAKMQIKRMDSMLDLREMLTPEQREKFKRMVDHRRPPRGKR